VRRFGGNLKAEAMEGNWPREITRNIFDFVQWLLVTATLFYLSNKTKSPIVKGVTGGLFLLLLWYVQSEINHFLINTVYRIKPYTKNTKVSISIVSSLMSFAICLTALHYAFNAVATFVVVVGRAQ
jgi:hypothetical protein